MFFRLLVVTHRYIGIAIGWLLLLWCLSGFVMMYVPYPELRDPARLAGLAPLDVRQCCKVAEAIFSPEQPIADVQVRMLAGRPTALVKPDVGPAVLIDLASGTPIESIAATDALAAARLHLPTGSIAKPVLLGSIQRDQWTVYPRYGNDLPLHHIRLGDAAGTEVYVSGVSGQVVQKTNRGQRFWNWLGAVPHWLYFTQVRQRPALWNNLVIYSSLVGCFLVFFGLYLGIHQLRRQTNGTWFSPYRRWHYWHHVAGLVFGVVTLTWVFSGLMSMQPWGFLESRSPGDEMRRLQGAPTTWRTASASLVKIGSNALPINTVEITSSQWQGGFHLSTTTVDGLGTRYNADWSPTPLRTAELAGAARLMDPAAQFELLEQEDDFYYGRVSEAAPLPVARVVLADATTYYLDLQNGAVIKRVDADARGFRWLHLGLHRLDFSAWMRWRPVRDVWMWALLLGATVVCLTGTWVGIRRLAPRPPAGAE